MKREKYVETEEERKQNRSYQRILKEIRTPKSDEEIDALLQACVGDLNAVANRKDNKSMTLLHHAIRSKNYHLAKRLVSEYGAEVNVRDKAGTTPLHMVCKAVSVKKKNTDEAEPIAGEEWAKLTLERRKRGSNFSEHLKQDVLAEELSTGDDIITFLVEHGASLDGPDYCRSTPLHYAVLYNQPEDARKLIKNNADLECVDIEGLTPLLLAAQKDRAMVARVLLEAGANFSAVDNEENNVLHLCSHKETITLPTLCAYINGIEPDGVAQLLKQLNKSGDTPTSLAVKADSLDMIDHIFQFDFKENLQRLYANGQNLLHIAAYKADPYILPVLMQNRLDIDSMDDNRNTPLLIAMQSVNWRMACKLIEYGARTNVCNNNGVYPVMLACQQADEYMVDLLLEEGAELFVSDCNKKNVIYYAIEFGQYALVKQLLDRSEDKEKMLNWADKNGDTILHLAATKRDENLVQELLQEGADCLLVNSKRQMPLHIAAANGCLPIVRRLGTTWIAIGREDENGNTPLHCAVQHGYANVVSELLDIYPTAHALKNDQGRTALAIAAKKNQTGCIDAIMRVPTIDVNTTDKSGKTPLMMACEKGNLEAVRSLLNHRAQITYRISENAKQFAGWNALNLAIWHGHLECVLELLTNEHWRDAMMNRALDLKGNPMTALRQMIKKLPKAAQFVFDKCVEHNELPGNPPTRLIKFDFKFLEDLDTAKENKQCKRFRASCDCCPSRKRAAQHEQYPNEDQSGPQVALLNAYQNSKLEKKNKSKLIHPLRLMLNHDRAELISHSLVQSLVSRMWYPLLAIYLLNIVFYFLFVGLFTSFMVLTDPPYRLSLQSNITTEELCSQLEQKGQKAYRLFVQFPKYALLIGSIINLMKETAHILVAGWAYLIFENLIEWAIFVLAILTTIDTSGCTARTGLRENWQWQAGTVGLTLAWVNMLFFIQKLFAAGNYVGTFVLISKNLLILFVIFTPFWIAFMLGFHLLLANQYAFMHMGNSLMKMITMTSGEVDFQSIMYSHYGANSGPEVAVYYASITYAFMLIYICTMTIGLQNMLTAIAVGDVNEMQGKARFERLRMTASTLLDLRRAMVSIGLWRPIPSIYIYNQNESTSVVFGLIYRTMGGTEDWKSNEGKKENEEDGVASRLNELEQTIIQLQESASNLQKKLMEEK